VRGPDCFPLAGRSHPAPGQSASMAGMDQLVVPVRGSCPYCGAWLHRRERVRHVETCETIEWELHAAQAADEKSRRYSQQRLAVLRQQQQQAQAGYA